MPRKATARPRILPPSCLRAGRGSSSSMCPTVARRRRSTTSPADMMFCDLGTILPLHQVGKVAIIAVATLKQLPQLPATPSIDESGVRAFTSTTFYSLMAPPKTPAEIRAEHRDCQRDADVEGAGEIESDRTRRAVSTPRGWGVREGRSPALGQCDPRCQYRGRAVDRSRDHHLSARCQHRRFGFLAVLYPWALGPS